MKDDLQQADQEAEATLLAIQAAATLLAIPAGGYHQELAPGKWGATRRRSSIIKKLAQRIRWGAKKARSARRKLPQHIRWGRKKVRSAKRFV
ncbi:hypothetical protein SLA2020_260360 [Shorea laevis]